MQQHNETISPHGGKLINRIVEGPARDEALREAAGLERLTLNAREMSDVEMIATGVYSPLEGFMGRESFESVVEKSHLPSSFGRAPGGGAWPWTIPVTIAVKRENAARFAPGRKVTLMDPAKSVIVGTFAIDDQFEPDKKREAERVYRTTDAAHPGVAAVEQMGPTYLGGKITVLNRPTAAAFTAYRRDPADTRREFALRGWKRVVAFQTRNPVHRAHEYIQKCALEIVDGLLLHPLVGETKSDDIPADVRMRCYEVLLENYYPKDRVLLRVLPAAMRYAGPREAIFHAIMRKNYGCTHFIVGRDHAGVGNYYGTYDAQKIFDEFDPAAMGITPLFFDHTFFCSSCGAMASTKTCPHPAESRVALSGTRVREMLGRGEIPPVQFTRPEVAEVLIASYRKG
ncbi:MAG: sulfate adenylyltransferase [Deltaproteobacteria bacterium]|nr:sulfate adenylyltransferase [Deltaproteobacteria bacterium]